MAAVSDSPSTTQSLTTQLAEACAQFSYDALPAATQQRAKLVLLDTLGAILNASRPIFPGTRKLRAFVESESADGQYAVIGTDIRTTATNAALMNGFLGYAIDNESHHGEAILHAAAAVLPATWATAQEMGSDGTAVLTSLVLGIDVACRVSLAIGPNDLYIRGFHPTSIAGTFGAAAAAGYLLGLDRQQFEHAFGLAATETSGLLAWSSDETEESRPLNPGLAARNGLSSAKLAKLDFGAPQGIFDSSSKYNVFKSWSLDGVGAPHRLMENFGTTFAVDELTFKLYACCAFLHPGLDGLLSILESEKIAASDIADIVIRFPRTGAPIIDNNELRSHRAQYILPLAVLRQAVHFEDVINDRSDDPQVRALAERTTFIQDDELDPLYPERYVTILEIVTKDGATHSRRVDFARGTPQNPTTPEEIITKFRQVAAARVDEATIERIITMVEQFDAAASVDELLELLTVS